MRKLYLSLMLSGLLVGGAIAMPVEAADQPEQAARPDIVQTLYDLNLASTAERVQQRGAQMTKIQSFPFPPLPGQCEGYEASLGCTITFNDGQWCTQRCGFILEVCDCVR